MGDDAKAHARDGHDSALYNARTVVDVCPTERDPVLGRAAAGRGPRQARGGTGLGARVGALARRRGGPGSSATAATAATTRSRRSEGHVRVRFQLPDARARRARPLPLRAARGDAAATATTCSMRGQRAARLRLGQGPQDPRADAHLELLPGPVPDRRSSSSADVRLRRRASTRTRMLEIVALHRPGRVQDDLGVAGRTSSPTSAPPARSASASAPPTRSPAASASSSIPSSASTARCAASTARSTPSTTTATSLVTHIKPKQVPKAAGARGALHRLRVLRRRVPLRGPGACSCCDDGVQPQSRSP